MFKRSLFALAAVVLFAASSSAAPVTLTATLRAGDLVEFASGSVINESLNGTNASAQLNAYGLDNHVHWTLSAEEGLYASASVGVAALLVDPITFIEAGTYEVWISVSADAMRTGGANRSCSNANMHSSVSFDGLPNRQAFAGLSACIPSLLETEAWFSFDVTAGQQLTLRWNTVANVLASSNPVELGSSAFLSANNSSWVTIIPLTGGRFTSRSGVDYTQGPSSSVPEPTSALLFGLAVVRAGIRFCRQKRTSS